MREYGAEENIRIYEEVSNRMMEVTFNEEAHNVYSSPYY
jgi:hypothetical protein